MKYVFFTILALFSMNIGLLGQCTGLQIVAFSSDEDKLMIRATADIPATSAATGGRAAPAAHCLRAGNGRGGAIRPDCGHRQSAG